MFLLDFTLITPYVFLFLNTKKGIRFKRKEKESESGWFICSESHEWQRDAVMERCRTYWSCMGMILVQLGRQQDWFMKRDLPNTWINEPHQQSYLSINYIFFGNFLFYFFILFFYLFISIFIYLFNFLIEKNFSFPYIYFLSNWP